MQDQFRAKRVKEALSTINDAHSKLASVVMAEYPVGSRAAWLIPRSEFAGEGNVLEHGYGCDRVKVHNDVTGKDYWISVDRLV